MKLAPGLGPPLEDLICLIVMPTGQSPWPLQGLTKADRDKREQAEKLKNVFHLGLNFSNSSFLLLINFFLPPPSGKTNWAAEFESCSFLKLSFYLSLRLAAFFSTSDLTSTELSHYFLSHLSLTLLSNQYTWSVFSTFRKRWATSLCLTGICISMINHYFWENKQRSTKPPFWFIFSRFGAVIDYNW